MVNSERLVAYLHSLDTGNSEYLNGIEAKAKADGVPIIRQEMQSFLHVFLELKKPARILEVGAAVGFSSLLMAEYTGGNTEITTIECYEPRIIEARKNIAGHPQGSHVHLIEGDATEVLKTLDGPYDIIFMDAAKGQYINFLPEIMRLLPVGGMLISDNVLQSGDLLESHYAVERRNRTIYKRMRDYLYELKHMDEFVTSVVPIGDGASISVRVEPESKK